MRVLEVASSIAGASCGRLFAAARAAVGVAAIPALANRDLVESEHLAARRSTVTWDQPDVGLRTFPGFPLHFSASKVVIGPAPALGADNIDVLASVGYGGDEIFLVAAAVVISDRPPW